MKTLTLTPEQIDVLNEALEFYGEDLQDRLDMEDFYEKDEIEEFESTISVIDSIQELL